MRIRQIALVAADLDVALADLTEVLGIDVGFHDEGVAVFGLRNGVMPVGEHFLEVVSPKQEGTTAARYLHRRRGDGGYMVIFQTHDLARRRRHLADAGVRVAWEIALDDIETVHLHPRDTGGAIVSVDEARPWESWRWAGPSWREHVRTGRVTGIGGVEIQSDDPDTLAQKWAHVFELPLAEGSRMLRTDGGETIEFCKTDDDRGEGIRSVLVRAADPEAIRSTAAARGLAVHDDGAVVICGTRFVLI
jgi:hypothetical protein